ncbi:Eco57I restriction-modification methylase domain-containing protein [Shinella sp. BYT-45]|uniref:Eco57I restriction-modification methylase domain-containing protein n=1 Tax=Shinella sp. BYT-45 TaxID=3377377 RepID=UPI003980F386
MASLDRTLRKDLEKTVKQARRVAEAGARKAMAQLGVGDAESPKHLSTDERALRNRLRAHGRQLGDKRDAKTGMQETARLVQECAYEHWHRMLFARFLAETDLLIEPDSGVAITLDEVQELAREKATDWLPLASDYAERMLPQIFRKDDPVLQISLPPETRSEMEDRLKGLPKAVFEADDSLGWVYQFWQADKKEAVNKSEVKIGADELPAVTQLFTEDYMVLFLLHNTLGAWWAGKVLAGNPALAASASSEDELRAACKVGDIEWGYLRFVRETGEDGAEGPWRPAAGTFDGWPKAAKDLTVLDPCMGSGHFLVFALPILVAFRMAEEGLAERAAIDAVLRDNLFGLEIDPRCTQIAAFNLAFAAWRRTGFHPLPQLNLACSGLAIGVTKAEWLKLAEKAVAAADPGAKRDLLGVEDNLLTHGLEERVKNGLEALYDLFAKAPWLGSLIDPRRAGGDIFKEGFDRLEPLIGSILQAANTDEAREMAVSAQGMARAAQLLSGKYCLVVTNVPYLGRGQQDQELKAFSLANHKDAKNDLATVFNERCWRFLGASGSLAAVFPQNWMFLTSYRKFREKSLKGWAWNSLAQLGSGAFDAISGEVVKAILLIQSASRPHGSTKFGGIDLSGQASAMAKAEALRFADFSVVNQLAQLRNPESKVVLAEIDLNFGKIQDVADVFEGLHTGDYPRFGRSFWEIPRIDGGWELQEDASREDDPYGGKKNVILWEKGNGQLIDFVRERLDSEIVTSWIKGEAAWGKRGVSISCMGDLRASLYMGGIFTHGAFVLIPKNPRDLAALWEYAKSEEFLRNVRALDQKVAIARKSIAFAAFDIAKWRKVVDPNTEAGNQKPKTGDPSLWIFSGRPDESYNPLHTAIAKLLGYVWPRESGATIADLVVEGSEALAEGVDEDGIVCLTAVRGEAPAGERLTGLLSKAFGADWSAAKLSRMLGDVGFQGKTLDDWLRDGFFEQHCTLFQQRPFIWHIWDGRRDGFHALVNYHRLTAPNGEGRRTLEKLIYSYLGDWIDRQRADQKAGEEGADARLAHAEHLRDELIKILEGEPPYDIFVRWKPLHEQPIGWDPDINDGVRMNIRPFMTAGPLGAKAKGACILRSTPKIKWDKDRGKEPTRDKDDYPWFWGWDETSADFAGRDKFDGNRWNDLHYTRAVKQAARDRRRAKSGGAS